MKDLLIKDVRIVDPSQGLDRTGFIYIKDGKIAALDGDMPQCENVIDGRNLTAAPGLVDMHVHLRDPGQIQKEDIITGCNAAAAGGVTSLLAMPNTSPVADNGETVEYILKKAENAKARVYVAASITKGLKGSLQSDIEELKCAGATALSDDGRPVENSEFLRQAMKSAQKYNMTVVSHCEDLYLAKGGKINEGRISKQLGIKGIPAAAEDCGTAREIALAAAENLPIHICHVSTSTSVDLIRDAKNRGVKVTAETAPHYFTLTEEELLKKDADYRMNPPLRTEEDRLAIIRGLKDGTIDCIATDHAPHTPQEKADFLTAPNGSIGMETSLSAGITALVSTGQLTINQLIEKMSLNPARILKLNAGTLKVGARGDVVIFDIDEKWTVDTERLHGKSKNTPFKNMTLQGRVKYTVKDGEIVYSDDNI